MHDPQQHLEHGSLSVSASLDIFWLLGKVERLDRIVVKPQMDKPFPGPSPGLLYTNSKPVHPEKLLLTELDRWYEDIHLPDVLNLSGIHEACRWQALDSDTERPFLATYPLLDVHFLNTDEFKGCRQAS